jgi:hypothetical protein
LSFHALEERWVLVTADDRITKFVYGPVERSTRSGTEPRARAPGTRASTRLGRLALAAGGEYDEHQNALYEGRRALHLPEQHTSARRRAQRCVLVSSRYTPKRVYGFATKEAR